jgi:hypothetical protein
MVTMDNVLGLLTACSGAIAAICNMLTALIKLKALKKKNPSKNKNNRRPTTNAVIFKK